MKDGPNIARIGALLGDPARADALTALMTDRALTATELAAIAGVTKQTMSAHLSKLLEAALVAVDQQGRHRYFKLANEDVGVLLESMMGVAFRTGAVRLVSSPREPALRKARVCYDHLAGELGVMGYESLLRNGVLRHCLNRGSAPVLPACVGSRMRILIPTGRCDNVAPIAGRAWTGASGDTISRDRWVLRC